MGRKDFAAPSGGGGGGAPFASGMGGADDPDPFRGIIGGGGGGAAPLEGSMSGGGGGAAPLELEGNMGGGGGCAAPLEGSMGGGGGGEGRGNLVGSAFEGSPSGDCLIGCGGAGTRFSCSMGCSGDDIGIIGVPADTSLFGGSMSGEGGVGARISSVGLVTEVIIWVVSGVVAGLSLITSILLTISLFLVPFKSDLGTSGVSFLVLLSLVSTMVFFTSKLLPFSISVIGSLTFLFKLKALESWPPTLDNAFSARRFTSTGFSFPTARTLRDQRVGGL